jgi:uncharacterized protein (TIGR02284 family)
MRNPLFCAGFLQRVRLVRNLRNLAHQPARAATMRTQPMSAYIQEKVMTAPAATLNELIAITRDGLDFYSEALGQVKNPHLKIVFRGIIDAKHQLIGALSERVRERGEQPSPEGTLAGTFRKLYADLLARISREKQAVYIAQLEQSEDRLLAAFEQAAADATVRDAIVQNLPKVRLCHAEMRNLKMDLAA